MSGAKGFLAACALIGGACVGTTAAWAADQLVLPSGARVGIVVMMPAEVTHFHVSKSRLKSFMRTYRVTWPVPETVDDRIALMLKTAGLEPVFLDPSDALYRQRQAWIISSLRTNNLPRAAEEEIGRILESGKVDGLILVAPGPNSNPESVQGNRLRKLPSYVQGWGFSTSDEPDEITKPVVFNLTQILVIGRSAESSELIFREWGGAFVYEWPGFEPAVDPKALSPDEVSRLRPVLQDVLQRQIDRVAEHIRVSG